VNCAAEVLAMRLFVLLSLLLAPTAGATRSPAPVHPSAHPSPAATPLSPEELFSRRALRRARLLIQMRMLQLRDERLECVREAILRRLPLELRPNEPTTSTCRGE
jgi:hypothetical protein